MGTKKPSQRSKNTARPIEFKLNGGLPPAEATAARHRAELKYLTDQNRLLRQHLESARRKPRLITPLAAKRYSHGDRLRVILGDTHGSAMDPAAVGAVIADIKHLKPQEIIHLGDGVDCGVFLAQHHTMGYVAETVYSYEEDMATANRVLDDIQNAAGAAEFDYLEGNHERRVETWCITQTLRHQKDCELLRRALAPEFLLHLKARGIKYYRQGEYYGERTPGTIRKGKCFFWHGTSTAKNAATVNLQQIGGNVVFGHTHRQQGDSG